MEFTAKQIAAFINGKIEGDENASVNTFAKIEEGKPGAHSFQTRNTPTTSTTQSRQ